MLQSTQQVNPSYIMIVVLLLKSLTYLIQHPPGTYANQMAFLLQQTLQTLTPSATPSIGNLLSQLQLVSQSNNIHTSKLYLMYEYNFGARTSSAARRCCFRLTAASTATTSCRTSCSCCVTSQNSVLGTMSSPTKIISNTFSTTTLTGHCSS
jgi:hypothetical protein